MEHLTFCLFLHIIFHTIQPQMSGIKGNHLIPFLSLNPQIQQRYKSATAFTPSIFDGSSPGAGKFGYLQIRNSSPAAHQPQCNLFTLVILLQQVYFLYSFSSNGLPICICLSVTMVLQQNFFTKCLNKSLLSLGRVKPNTMGFEWQKELSNLKLLIDQASIPC